MEKDTAKMTIYKYDEIEVFMDEFGEPWMSQKQIAKLLGITRQSIGDILLFAFRNGDLNEENTTCSLSLQYKYERVYDVKHYNLDALLLVGFRSKATQQAVKFRAWVSMIVREYGIQNQQKKLQEAQDMVDLQKQIIATLRENAENNQNLLDHIQQLVFDSKMQAVPKMLQAEVIEDYLKKLQEHKMGEAYQRKLKGGE